MRRQNLTTKIAFLLGEEELRSTQDRYIHLPISLRNLKKTVTTVNTIYPSVREKVSNYLTDHLKVQLHPLLNQPMKMKDRDDVAREYIKTYYDFKIPDTDFPIWKCMAYDDYLWNLCPQRFKKLPKKFDFLVTPLHSTVDALGRNYDAFATQMMFRAKTLGVPVIGVQYSNRRNVNPYVRWLCDYMIARNEQDASTLGTIETKKVYSLSSLADKYAVSTVEDPYLSGIYGDVPIKEDELGVIIINHPRGRQHIRRIVNILSELPFKVSLFFVTINYVVKFLHEQDIYKEFIEGHIKENLKTAYLADIRSCTNVILFNDLVIGFGYNEHLEFGRRYGKDVLAIEPDNLGNFEGKVKEALLAVKEKKDEQQSFSRIIQDIIYREKVANV